MNITKIAIENNRTTIIILLIIVTMGLIGYNQLSRDSMPPFTIRVCTIVTNFPGASQERVEELITDKIEKVAQELPELKNVTSESRTGLSVVSVSLTDDIPQSDLQAVWDRLRRKIESIEQDLPSGIMGPDVKDDGIGVVYGIQLALTGEGFSFYELKQYADDIRDDLIKLDDASEVEIKGIQEEQVYVEFDNSSLAKIGLTAGQLQNIISSTNIVFPGGEVSLEDERIVLEPTGNFEGINDLENTIINIGNSGETVKLGEITTISRAYKNPTNRIVKIDGEDGLVIAVALQDGANLIELGKQVDQKVVAYNQSLPVGIQLERISSSDLYVDTKISDFVSNVLQSVVIVLAVMLLFLGLRTGLVVASLIPTAMIMTLWLMDLMDVGLNQVSLAALIMALGMLVDNAIVVSEAMMVKMEDGMKAKDAAIAACSELLIPLLVSSLTTSAAFLAFYLADSSMGEMMGPLFVVITMALLSSWIMAMTVIPMFAINMIKVNAKTDNDKPGLFDRLNIYYRRLLATVLKHSGLFVLVIIGLFVGSLFLFGQLPFIFFPDSDRNLVTVDINLPLGTKIERTEKLVDQVESFIEEQLLVNEDRNKGITSYSTFISEGPESYDLGYQPGESNTGYAHLLLNTSSFEDNNMVMEVLEEYCFENFPDAKIDIAPLSGGGGGGADVEVRLSGNSPEMLFQLSEQIKQQMNSLPMTRNINDDWGPKIKKFVIDIDQDKANRAGLTNQDIATSLRTALSGFNAGDFRDGEDNIPIIMRSQGSQAVSANELESLPIFAQNSGQNVPLAQVAAIETDWQYAKIKRRNLYRTMIISCDAKSGYTATDVTNALVPLLEEASKEWPAGAFYSLGGESEQSSEAMGAVMAKLPLAGFIILLLLVSQFNSFRKTSIVLSTIPLGIIGVILGLLLFRSYFGFMAFLGVISLAGIVINNAIVLIDRIQIEEELGKTPYQAILDAAQQRFRPILLTTFTTTLGMIPLYLGGGLMWEPMAISIMIGLLFATVITLLFIPVIYKLFFRVKK
ncbi:MAG: efflux RND transporter permease subunit [Chitinophagales bacterium]|nr:efflux RND transporter permease subunit [Chitinophagales bacterium]